MILKILPVCCVCRPDPETASSTSNGKSKLKNNEIK